VTIPSKIRAGDIAQWRIDSTEDVFGNTISSPDWTVKYYLRTARPKGATITGSAYAGGGWEFTIASSVTTDFSAGDWYYQAVADKGGNEKQTIFTGSFEVLEGLSYTGTPAFYDGRTQLEKDLETIETAIRNIISGGGIQEYKIGARSAKKYELSELIMLKAQIKAEIARAGAASKIANGLGNPRSMFVRFN